MQKPRLIKPIEQAIGRYPLYWDYFYADARRTVTSGFALYAQTDVGENGTRRERRLYVTSSVGRAEAINELLIEQYHGSEVRIALRLNLARVIQRWRDSLLITKSKVRSY